MEAVSARPAARPAAAARAASASERASAAPAATVNKQSYCPTFQKICNFVKRIFSTILYYLSFGRLNLYPPKRQPLAIEYSSNDHWKKQQLTIRMNTLEENIKRLNNTKISQKNLLLLQERFAVCQQALKEDGPSFNEKNLDRVEQQFLTLIKKTKS